MRFTNPVSHVRLGSSTRTSPEHWAFGVIYDRLHFCGCGLPEEALRLVTDLLTLAPWHDAGNAVGERIGGEDGTRHLVMYLIDGAGLIEHGGSITGSWLTDDGVRFLNAMQTLDTEVVMDAGYSCSDCPKT